MGSDDAASGRARPDHGCFGCGDLNPCGLKLVFAREGDGVTADFMPRPQDEGFFGVVHGGIVTTLLDEAMAWAAFATGTWAVTAKLDVRFRQPVHVGVAVRVSARVVRARGRLIEASGEVRSTADGELLAEATGAFFQVPTAQADAWAERYLAAADGSAE